MSIHEQALYTVILITSIFEDDYPPDEVDELGEVEGDRIPVSVRGTRPLWAG